MNTTHPILGIDIGKEGIHVAFPPSDSKTHPRHWPHVVISYADPRWWTHLLDLVADHCIVAAEPTGHHLLAPVANVIHTYRPAAQVWQVDGKQTAYHRETHLSSAKNDRLDAIALALIARDISLGNQPRNCRPYDFARESQVQALRMQVNIYMRLSKESTRTLNRLNALAHNLFPAFAIHFDTWIRAVQTHQAVTPAQIRALAEAQPPLPPYNDGRARRYLVALSRNLPDIDADPNVVAAVIELAAYLDHLTVKLKATQEDITHIIDQPPFDVVTRRWRTIPGSNNVAIAAIHVATYGNALNFDRPGFCAALGTSPKTSISGSVDKTRAPRKGYRPARALLHMWAAFLVGPKAPPNPIRDYYSAEGRSFATARNKLARILWGVARNPRL